MKTNLLSVTTLVLTFLFLNSNINAQSNEELKQLKLAEKKEKLKKVKEREAQKVFVLGYHGGTMAPIGFNFYMMDPDKVGFYGSVRFGRSVEKQLPNEPFKGLNLNLGLTKNLFFPVALYAAAGISDYEVLTPKAFVSPYAPEEKYDSDWQFGMDTSFGLILHIKGIELQGGVSLFNFSKPEFCFGIGFNALRSTK